MPAPAPARTWWRVSIAERLSQLWGQQVVVVNRPSGGGIVATRSAATAAPDGHTLYMAATSVFTLSPEEEAKAGDRSRSRLRQDRPGQRAAADLRGRGASCGISTLPELIALAKAKPGDVLLRRQHPRLAAASGNRAARQPHRHPDDVRAVSGDPAGAARHDGRAHRGDRAEPVVARRRDRRRRDQAARGGVTETAWRNLPERADRRGNRAGLRGARMVRADGAGEDARTASSPKCAPTCAPCSTRTRWCSGSRRSAAIRAICRPGELDAFVGTRTTAVALGRQAGRRDARAGRLQQIGRLGVGLTHYAVEIVVFKGEVPNGQAEDSSGRLGRRVRRQEGARARECGRREISQSQDPGGLRSSRRRRRPSWAPMRPGAPSARSATGAAPWSRPTGTPRKRSASCRSSPVISTPR